jgi:hypothetical protein
MKLKSILLTAAATISLAAATMAQVPNYVPTNGLVGWWPFNGNANDESGNGNNGGSIGAALTADRFGTASSAYSFDGLGNFIFVNNSAGINPLTAVSVTAWINANSWGASVYDNTIVGNDNWQSGPSGYVLRCGNNGQLSFNIAKSFGNWEEAVSTSNTMIENTWYFVVGTYDGTQIKLYINGSLEDTLASMGPLFPSFSSLLFGQCPDPTANRFFNGKIDDIGIWNRALTQQEISNLYYGTVSGLNQYANLSTLNVFPNPANNQITIDCGNIVSKNGYTLKIVNSIGQTVVTTSINQQISKIDLSTWTANGIYFVQLIDPQNNPIENRKIVIQ